MKSVLIELDDPTYKALNHIAPAAKRQRAQFIRNAVRKAIREAEYEHIRNAYVTQPDSAADADDWSNAEDYKP
jgi:predicted transcriptional regulator